RVRAGWLLRRYGTVVEAVLEARRFLGVEYRTGANIILGFSEELCARRRVSADYFRNRRPLGPPLSCPSVSVFPAVPCESGAVAMKGTRLRHLYYSSYSRIQGSNDQVPLTC